MDAKEAKEIMRTHKGISPSVRTDPDWYYASEFMMANGYLNALTGPEVKALVWALIRIKEHAGDECSLPGDIAEDALKTYKEAVGKPGEGERG